MAACNRGFELAVWDRLYGTLYVPHRQESFRMGLGDGTDEQWHTVRRMYCVAVRERRAATRDSRGARGSLQGEAARTAKRRTQHRPDQRATEAAPRLASSSARSLPSWPAWPFTHSHSISCCAASSSSSRQRSAFLTGFLSAVRQPFFFQPCIHLLMPSCTYLRIGVQAHAARALERFERADDRHQLHAVVGRRGFAAVELAHAAAATQERAPAADARIALARAVGVDLDDVSIAAASPRAATRRASMADAPDHARTTFAAGSRYTPRVSTISFACFLMSA